ncbi:MAG: DUF1801 domain-containing protein [Planctomycetota bacterium]
MKKSTPAADPDCYVAALSGWQKDLVALLRKAVRAGAKLDEEVKWGHLVYSGEGPAILIRAEERRVLFGFWRGKRLREIEPRLKASGGYELANIEFEEGDTLAPGVAKKLAAAAAALDRELGDPRLDAKKKSASTKAAKKPAPKKKSASRKPATKISRRR